MGRGEEITKEKVGELTSPENLDDDEIMVPVDMCGVSEKFDDVEQMVEELGPKGTAEALVKAADNFETHKDQLQEEESGDGEEPEEEDDDDEDASPPPKKAKTS